MGAVALALSQGTTGCGTKVTLKIRSLKNAIPAQLAEKFRRSVNPSPVLQVMAQPQLSDLFTELQSWRRKAGEQKQNQETPPADLVMLGDYWLEKAIAQQLIQPLNPAQFTQWSQLSPIWQKVVRRNEAGLPDAQGKIWGAPYRWGTTVIAYRADKFKALGWVPTDWSDLWREELRDRISLLDNPREVIGLTLKKLGKSYNTANLDKVANLKAELRRLHQQVKLYSSDSYLQPLLLGDTWLAVGWSSDILPLMQNQPDIVAVVPVSGTAMWVDLWVKPWQAETSKVKGEKGKVQSAQPQSPSVNLSSDLSLAEQWIDFCWQPPIATQLSILSQVSSPVIVSMKSTDLPAALRENPLLLPEAAKIEKSEFLYPLSQEAIEQYRSLWQEMRKLRHE